MSNPHFEVVVERTDKAGIDLHTVLDKMHVILRFAVRDWDNERYGYWLEDRCREILALLGDRECAVAPEYGPGGPVALPVRD